MKKYSGASLEGRRKRKKIPSCSSLKGLAKAECQKSLGGERVKRNVYATYLCAVKFWSGSYPKGPSPDYRGSTLTSGVRHVVRKQGFTAADVRRTERALAKRGLIKVQGNGVTLTDQGRRHAGGFCANIKLSPWTDNGNPGAALSGKRKRR